MTHFQMTRQKSLKIVGLFEVVVIRQIERNNYNEASYYDYANNALTVNNDESLV